YCYYSHAPSPPAFSFFFLHRYAAHRGLLSFPTRRSSDLRRAGGGDRARGREPGTAEAHDGARDHARARAGVVESRREPEHDRERSEEHTSELQSRSDLVCRLLLEKKKKKTKKIIDEISTT